MKGVYVRSSWVFYSTLFVFCFLSNGYSQVGIGTQDPQATLDVRGVNHNGTVTALDGVLVPRVNSLGTGGSQEGQLVYLIADVGALKKGFYHWNGSNWSAFSKSSTTSAVENVVEPDVVISGAPGPVNSFTVTPNTAITNNTAFNTTILVSGVVGNTSLVTIRLNIIHTWDSDIDIFLGDPTGKWVELSTDNGGSGDNYTNTLFEDAAPNNIITGSAPFLGSFKPEGTLSASGTPVDRTGTIPTLAGFNGLNPNGNWILRIGDDAGGDTGTFVSATLRISGSLPVNWVSLGEVAITYFDDTAIIVQSTYSGDPLDLSGVKTALTRSETTVTTGTAAAILPGTILNYASASPSSAGNMWVNTFNLARDEGLVINSTYYYQLWRQGNIETPLASNETFTLIPMRIQE